MILTLVTGEKIKVKESWKVLDFRTACKDTYVSILHLTKLSESGHVIEDGQLKVKYVESVIRVNVNHIVSYEETNT
jgi:hypothetical protein